MYIFAWAIFAMPGYLVVWVEEGVTFSEIGRNQLSLYTPFSFTA